MCEECFADWLQLAVCYMYIVLMCIIGFTFFQQTAETSFFADVHSNQPKMLVIGFCEFYLFILFAKTYVEEFLTD